MLIALCGCTSMASGRPISSTTSIRFEMIIVGSICGGATQLLNSANRGDNRNNTSGIKGVSWFRRKWCARIRINWRLLHLGGFATSQEAALAYSYAAYGLHGEFARPHWHEVMRDIRGMPKWSKPVIEELSLDREEFDRLQLLRTA